MGQSKKLDELEKRVGAAEKGIETLVEAFTQNLTAVREGFTLNDVHIRILQNLCEDVVLRRVSMWPPPQSVVDKLKKMLADGSDEADVIKEWRSYGWGHADAPGERVDMQWYYAQCDVLENLDMAQYLEEAGKGEVNGTGKES